MVAGAFISGVEVFAAPSVADGVPVVGLLSGEFVAVPVVVLPSAAGLQPMRSAPKMALTARISRVFFIFSSCCESTALEFVNPRGFYTQKLSTDVF